MVQPKLDHLFYQFCTTHKNHQDKVSLSLVSTPANGDIRLDIITQETRSIQLDSGGRHQFLLESPEFQGLLLPDDVRRPLQYLQKQIAKPWSMQQHGNLDIQAQGFKDGRIRIIFLEPVNQPFIVSRTSIQFLSDR
jgi:hypothetical protein